MALFSVFVVITAVYDFAEMYAINGLQVAC
jgi:hypothetical protein